MASLDVARVCRQYEVMRHDAATEVSSSCRGYGLTLLMTRGMPAWLDVMSTIALPPVEQVPTAGNRGLDLAPAVRSELACVLASLVFKCVPEGVPT